METPLVQCAGCDRAWHSPTMADGLRVVGSCPRCGGALIFTGPEPEPTIAERDPAQAAPAEAVAPHLILGVPRR